MCRRPFGILAANDFSRGSHANVLQTRSLLTTDVILGVKWCFSQAGVCPVNRRVAQKI